MKNKTRNALAGCMLMMAAMGAQAANVLQIGCNTNTKLFNTGFDAVSGGKLTTGIDPTWEATDIQAAAAIPPRLLPVWCFTMPMSADWRALGT